MGRGLVGVIRALGRVRVVRALGRGWVWVGFAYIRPEPNQTPTDLPAYKECAC